MGETKGPKVPVSEPAFGTMQMPRGAVFDEDHTMPAPIDATIVPAAGDAPATAPPAMPPELRYEYGDEIARGGMGRVVEATDTVLGRTVALKEALALDPEAIQRFHRETRITARLEHPSIVPVHDAGTSDTGAPFYVMRKISGRSLEELVSRAPELADRLALVPHIVAAANAIAHAHERGVVHRDIKPSNILAGELGETTVIDWGLAKAIGETDEVRARRAPSAAPLLPGEDDDDNIKTRAGIVFGTPGFMAPEQLRGAAVDERCDVYALGATLYHLLARKPPHYAKNGADMMRAAVDGPPQPLREIVPGVPPALATIVDKALAHDREARYHDARALADDLQRFLTGQLVKSHHYSNRDKLLRWVRNNRALVAVAASSLVALLAIAAFSFSRILAARDRADAKAAEALAQKNLADTAKNEALDRLNQVTIANARAVAMTEPTPAVALVKPLVTSPRWREARDVAAAARANGVAFALPASAHTISLELSRDGQRAISAGDDGVIRLYDLSRKEPMRVLFDAHVASPARFGDAEHTVVLFHDTHVTFVDVASGTHRDLETPTAVAKLEVAGPIAYYVDPQKELWKLDLAGGAPSKIPLDEAVDAIAPSPDGRWVALAGAQHVMLIDRTSTLPAEVIADGTVRELAWQADASQLAAITDEEVLAFTLTPAPAIIHRYFAGTHFAIALTRGRMIATGPTGVTWVQRDNPVPRLSGLDFTLGLHAARNDVIVAGRPNGLTLLTDDGDRAIASPVRLSAVQTSVHGSYVVAASDGKLLVWDLDAVTPRSLGDDPVVAAAFVSGDALVVTHVEGPAQWIDLRTNKTTPVGSLIGISELVPAPAGHRAVVIDGTHHGLIVAPVGDPVDLGGDLEQAAFADDQLVLGTTAGDIRLGDQPLVQRKALVIGLATAHRWIAAAFADRVVWRIDLATRTTSQLTADVAPIRGALAIRGDGTVVFGSGAEIRVWRPNGDQSVLGRLGRNVRSLAWIGEDRVLAIGHDGGAAIADVKPGGEVVPVALPLTGASLAADGSLVAALAPNGSIEVFDPAVGERWTIAQPRDPEQPNAVVAARPFVRSVTLAPDGRRIMAITSDRLLVWTLALPATPEATAPWANALTNATVSRTPGLLDWKL
ncbi:MAG TPA: WD40 repeat domain-containing serine/threonine-protein kinase [Kofleriaceae bacterium]